MHATEWAGGVAALHFVHKLLAGYGKDERVTRLLDTRTVYVLPRMTPDGVDATLDQGRFIRSVDRPYPSALPGPGIIPRDMNGDGRTRVHAPSRPERAVEAASGRSAPARAARARRDGRRLLARAARRYWSRATTAPRSPTSPSTRRSISAPTSRAIAGRPSARPTARIPPRSRKSLPTSPRSRAGPTSWRTSPATRSADWC